MDSTNLNAHNKLLPYGLPTGIMFTCAVLWFATRYNVHLRNVDALMMCVLPYHDQEPFIMTLRLLRLEDSTCDKWRWLEPVKVCFICQCTPSSVCFFVSMLLVCFCCIFCPLVVNKLHGLGNPKTLVPRSFHDVSN